MSSQVRADGFPKKWAMFCVTVLLLLGKQTEGYAATPSYVPDPSLKLSVENQHISAQIHHMSLQTVLSALSMQSTVTFILHGIDQDTLISTSFSNLPFEQGLERLLLGYDYAIIHVNSDAPRLTETSRQTREVMIFSRDSHTNPTSSNAPPLTIAPNVVGQLLFGQPHAKRQQDVQQTEDHSRSSESTSGIDEQGLLPLLEKAIGETDPETPQLVQEILNRLELGNE